MLFDKCARAYTKKEFDFNMSTMVSINTGIKQYLLDADPTKWARSHFMSKRYNLMTKNISECMNAILKEVRNRPIASLIEVFRKILQRWFYERQTYGLCFRSRLTIWAEVILQTQEELARIMTVSLFVFFFYALIIFVYVFL